ncbi:MAG: hypothetical protein O7C98_10265 [Planctomycetota bacterium]|nr:hypothetical protein [Planctomycetota bacterium]
MTRNLTLPLLFTALAFSGCAGTKSERKQAADRDRVESATAPFDATYFRDREHMHLALVFEIVDGQLRFGDGVPGRRPGSPPYRAPGAGSVRITYRDSSGKELGNYSIEDPVLARSCDFDQEREGELKLIARGTAEIIVPANPAIATVEISTGKDRVLRFDVSAQIKKALGDKD